MKTVDVLIIGQGLAGSTLAWRLAERGVSFLVVDRGGVDDHGRPSASRVAAGLLTPITGKRLTLMADWAPMRRSAESFYRRAEEWTGASFFDARPSLRLFASREEQQLFERRCHDPQYAAEVRTMPPQEAPAGLRADHGGFWMTNAARLDAAAFLDATRIWLKGKDVYRTAALDPRTDLETVAAGVVVRSLGVAAGMVAHCQGHTDTNPPGLREKLHPAHGDLLRVSAPGLKADGVVHCGAWIAPALDSPSEHRLVGSTYRWDHDDYPPSKAGRAELLAALEACHDGRAEVIEHVAATRPTTSDRRPIAELTNTPATAWFNGLGSKGALLAPWFSERLATELAAQLQTPAPKE